MNYRIINQDLIEILPEQTPIQEILTTIAKLSYETAEPRGLGNLQPHQAPSAEVLLDEYIETINGDPTMLLMSYVHGRDCRTKVFKAKDGRWIFDAYAFKQRKVTSQEFLEGIIKDNPQKFLDKVVQALDNESSQ